MYVDTEEEAEEEVEPPTKKAKKDPAPPTEKNEEQTPSAEKTELPLSAKVFIIQKNVHNNC